MSSLKVKFTESDKFLIGAELVPRRGILEREREKGLGEFLEGLSSDDRVDWISVTDNAGGNPMMGPLELARLIKDRGKEPLVHITCKDNNRNGLESLAWMYASEGLNNLLVLSGDYPVDGVNGLSQPVFDIDSVGLLKILKDMNRGLQVPGRKPGSVLELDKTDFFLGTTVSPFKFTEAEQMMQYQKFRLKVREGADFAISQIGYDMRKSLELFNYCGEQNLSIPLVGNVYKLTYGVAKLFNRGAIPGCTVSESLLERIEKERKGEDKGKAFYINLAAMQLAAFGKMGYRGAHVGGVENYRSYREILDKADEYGDAALEDLAKELTFPRTGVFYYFEKDGKTINPLLKKRVRKLYRKNVSFGYRFSRLVHSLAFSEKAPFYSLGKPLYTFLEKHGKLNRAAYSVERVGKAMIFECRECGDCSLADIAYLCPQSQCVKNQRNGPCGGSLDGRCELATKERDCIWVRAYDRTKYFGANPDRILDRPVIIKDNSLNNTSGWANYFLKRDHFSKD